MASTTRPQENRAAFTTPYSHIVERETEDADNYEYPDAAAGGGCGCFRRFCFGWRTHDGGESHNYLLQGAHEDSWVVAKFKKLRELSELVAGPKWKNLIRKIGKLCNPKKHNNQTTQFQYSPESYALNFAGYNLDLEEDDNLLHSFPSRFAHPNDQQRRAAGL